MSPERVVIGNAELWHGDCRDVLPLVRADACVSDPPYGIGYVLGASGRHDLAKRNSARPIAGDCEPFDPAHVLSFDAVVLFGADHFRARLPAGGTFVAWDKSLGIGPADNFTDAEFIWTNLRIKRNVLRFLWKGVACQKAGEENGARYHPTTKPQGVMGEVLRWLPAGTRTVIDPYMGSGSTGVAALRLGLRFIGVEIDRAHFNTACERIDLAQRQGVLDTPVATPNEALQSSMFGGDE